MFPAINLHLYGISLTMFDYRRVDGCEKMEFPLLFPSNQLNDDHLWLVSNAKVHIFAQHDRFHSPPIDVATSVQDVVHFCARLAFVDDPTPGALGGGQPPVPLEDLVPGMGYESCFEM